VISTFMQENTACGNEDPELWFNDEFPEVARNICQGCPVLDDCRRFADDREGNTPLRFLFGMVGGETPAERHNRRKAISEAA
jgi:hypothetical protein